MVAAWNLFDKDGTGINKEEFKYLMTQLGDKFTDEEADELIKEAGLDKDASV